MRTLYTPTFLGLFLLLPVLPGQSRSTAWFKDNSPTLGAGNAFPWGSEGVRYQTIVPGSLFKGMPALIQDIFVAGRTKDVEIVYGDIEIRMGITQQAAPTTNWKTNNPKPVTVYRGPLRVRFKVGKWTSVGLPRPYIFLPRSSKDNLCFEVIVWKVLDKGGNSTGPNFYFPLAGTSASPGGAISRAYRYKWTQNQSRPPFASSSYGNKMGLLLFGGNVVILGKGCKSSAGTELKASVPPNTWPSLGKPFTLNLVGAAPSTVAFLLLGRSDVKWGPLNLPFDLGPLGAPGCFLWTEALNFLPRTVGSQGTASMVLGVPNAPVLAGARLSAGWLNLDAKANALGAATSSYAKLILGT